MATRNFPVGAISEVIADCADALPGIEVAINMIMIANNIIRPIDPLL
jgi:hypothetical protein